MKNITRPGYRANITPAVSSDPVGFLFPALAAATVPPEHFAVVHTDGSAQAHRQPVALPDVEVAPGSVLEQQLGKAASAFLRLLQSNRDYAGCNGADTAAQRKEAWSAATSRTALLGYELVEEHGHEDPVSAAVALKIFGRVRSMMGVPFPVSPAALPQAKERLRADAHRLAFFALCQGDLLAA